MNDELARLTGVLARRRSLLVLCDYDDALAPPPTQKGGTPPARDAIDALLQLGGLPRTRAAIVSDRGLEDLRTRCGIPATPVGARGIELFARDENECSARGRGVTLELRRSRWWLQQAALWIAGAYPGAVVERRAFGVTLHVANLHPMAAHQAIEKLTELSATVPTKVHARRRSWSLTLSVLPSDHVSLIDALRETSDGTILYAGNDERAHAALHPSDVGCTIGTTVIPGAVATSSPIEFAQFLDGIAAQRAGRVGCEIDTDARSADNE
jgi:trehalose-6-phosphatase